MPKKDVGSFESLNKKLFDHINNTHNVPESLLTKRNKNDFRKDLKKIFHQETRKDRQGKVLSTLEKKRIFISATCAALVFIYFALNWGNWSGNIWGSMTNLFPSADDVMAGFFKWTDKQEILTKFLLIIPVIIIVIIIGIIYAVGALVIGGIALGFPIITAVAIYLFSNKLLESHVKNNVVSSKTIITGYALFTLICGWFIISEIPQIELFLKSKNITGIHASDNAQKAPSKYPPAIVIVKSANIRSGPSVDNKIIGKADKDDIVKVLEMKNGWLKINHNGKTGFIYSRLVKAL